MNKKEIESLYNIESILYNEIYFLSLLIKERGGANTFNVQKDLYSMFFKIISYIIAQCGVKKIDINNYIFCVNSKYVFCCCSVSKVGWFSMHIFLNKNKLKCKFNIKIDKIKKHKKFYKILSGVRRYVFDT